MLAQATQTAFSAAESEAIKFLAPLVISAAIGGVYAGLRWLAALLKGHGHAKSGDALSTWLDGHPDSVREGFVEAMTEAGVTKNPVIAAALEPPAPQAQK